MEGFLISANELIKNHVKETKQNKARIKAPKKENSFVAAGPETTTASCNCTLQGKRSTACFLFACWSN